MAANNENGPLYQDVEFTRTTSTKHWGGDLNPLVRKRKDGLTSAARESHNSTHPSYLRDTPRVIRTGGITGTLPSQSLLPSSTASPSTPQIPSQPPHSRETPPPTPTPAAPRLTQLSERQQAKAIIQTRGLLWL